MLLLKLQKSSAVKRFRLPEGVLHSLSFFIILYYVCCQNTSPLSMAFGWYTESHLIRPLIRSLLLPLQGGRLRLSFRIQYVHSLAAFTCWLCFRPSLETCPANRCAPFIRVFAPWSIRPLASVLLRPGPEFFGLRGQHGRRIQMVRTPAGALPAMDTILYQLLFIPVFFGQKLLIWRTCCQ